MTPTQQLELWLEGIIGGEAPDPDQLAAFEALLPSLEPAVLASLRPLVDDALSFALQHQRNRSDELDALGTKRAGLRRYGGLRPVATTRQKLARRA